MKCFNLTAQHFELTSGSAAPCYLGTAGALHIITNVRRYSFCWAGCAAEGGVSWLPVCHAASAPPKRPACQKQTLPDDRPVYFRFWSRVSFSCLFLTNKHNFQSKIMKIFCFSIIVGLFCFADASEISEGKQSTCILNVTLAWTSSGDCNL